MTDKIKLTFSIKNEIIKISVLISQTINESLIFIGKVEEL
jgi:hypothetical protein